MKSRTILAAMALSFSLAFSQSAKQEGPQIQPQPKQVSEPAQTAPVQVVLSNPPSTIELTKNVLEVLALLAAAAFFLFKMVDGWGLVNLSIELAAQRDSGIKGDWVAVNLKLTKGDQGSLELHTVELRCLPTGATAGESVRIPLIYPLKRKPEDDLNMNDTRIEWDKVDDSRPRLHLPPGESTQYSHVFNVPVGVPCQIEAIVIGKRPISNRYGQWRASIAVPLGSASSSDNQQTKVRPKGTS